MNDKLISKIQTEYKNRYGTDAEFCVCAPGRINLLGEHTDYNEGFVMPGAIDKAIYIAIGKTDGANSELFSLDFNENETITASAGITKGSKVWSNYIRGVIKQMFKNNLNMGQFHAVFCGDIPVGSGLSSSAALECGFAFAFNHLFGGNLQPIDLAFAGQEAEHEFTGVKCGIMDQFASVFGKKDHVIQLDCRSMEYKYHPLNLGDYELVLFNSMVHHQLASSEYNTRREQCEEGVAALKLSVNNGINSLRDANLSDLEALESSIPQKSQDRCRYIIEENQRVEEITKSLHANNLNSVGEIMRKTHEGLSKLFEVSCEELDYLVSLVDEEEAVLGARMMGGGFGGCTLNLVSKQDADQIIKKVTKGYFEKYNKTPEVYRVSLSDGVRLI